MRSRLVGLAQAAIQVQNVGVQRLVVGAVRADDQEAGKKDSWRSLLKSREVSKIGGT